MTRKIFQELIDGGHEIEFEYAGKRFSITYYEPKGREVVSFCEFYKEITDVETFDQLCEVERYGKKIIDMIESISDEDIDIL